MEQVAIIADHLNVKGFQQHAAAEADLQAPRPQLQLPELPGLGSSCAA